MHDYQSADADWRTVETSKHGNGQEKLMFLNNYFGCVLIVNLMGICHMASNIINKKQ
jgi:hypothetical protein